MNVFFENDEFWINGDYVLTEVLSVLYENSSVIKKKMKSTNTTFV